MYVLALYLVTKTCNFISFAHAIQYGINVNTADLSVCCFSDEMAIKANKKIHMFI